jgi:hypothetical protein
VELEDDGAIIVSGGQSPQCPDCELGHLCWAEAGYVPWHRICGVCGSHWDLHPVTYYQWRPDVSWTGTDRLGRVALVADMDPDDRLPAGVTHQALLALAIAAGTEPNGTDETQRIASASWARRARFYG